MLKMEYKQKDHQRIKQSNKFILDYQKLRDVRILNRKLVHLVGLPEQICHVDILKQKQFFGQYGKIKRILIKKNPNNFNELCDQIYVTFSNSKEASVASLCLNGFSMNKTQVKASNGLSRYCASFLEGKSCDKEDCGYYHNQAENDEWCFKEQEKYQKRIKQLKNSDIFKYLIAQEFDFVKFFTKFENEIYNILPGKLFMLKKFLKFVKRYGISCIFQNQNIQDKQFEIQLNQYLWQNKQNCQKHKGKVIQEYFLTQKNEIIQKTQNKNSIENFDFSILDWSQKYKYFQEEQIYSNCRDILNLETTQKKQDFARKKQKQELFKKKDQHSFSIVISHSNDSMPQNQAKCFDEINIDRINKRIEQIHFGDASQVSNRRWFTTVFQQQGFNQQKDQQKLDQKLLKILQKIDKRATDNLKDIPKYKTNNF